MNKIIKKINEEKLSIIINILIIGLFIILPLTYFQSEYKMMGTVALTLLVILLMALTKNINIEDKNKLFLIEWILFGYIVCIFLSYSMSPYRVYGLYGEEGRHEGIITLYTYIAIFYIMWKKFKFSKTIFFLITLTVVGISMVTILQSIFKILSYNQFTGVGIGTMRNQNFMSTYVTIFLPIFVMVYLKTNRKLYLISSMITFAALICARTSSGYITFLIYITIILIYAIVKKTKITRVLVLSACFVATFLIINTLIDGKIISEIKSTTDGMKYVQDIKTNDTNKKNTALKEIGGGRGYIYTEVLKMIKEKPLFGVGPDCLGLYVNDTIYLSEEYDRVFGKQILDKAHCEILHIAITTGIPSAICYLVFIGIIAGNIIKKFIKNKGNAVDFTIGLSIMAYLMQGMVNISVVQVAPMFWAILGIGLNIVQEKDCNKEEEILKKLTRKKDFESGRI